MKKFARFAILLLPLLATMTGCGGRGHIDPFDTAGYNNPAPWDEISDIEESQPVRESRQEIPAPIAAETDSIQLQPISKGRMARYNSIGNLGEVFNDSNRYQYAAAERIGIHPIECDADAYYLSKPVIEITSCQWYDVDTLTHSMPFLVPEAAALLQTIGRNFADSLKKREGEGHRFKVTSLLRDAHSVKRLRRVNRNATDSSTHKFGTTFDISYAKFNHYGKGAQLSDEELKYILGEVLRDLRDQGKCLVKFERKSPCYHITATGK